MKKDKLLLSPLYGRTSCRCVASNKMKEEQPDSLRPGEPSAPSAPSRGCRYSSPPSYTPAAKTT
eukprot:3103247-Amphidinium_carterae.1